MKQPYISIGIPIYNAEKFLDYAISSVLSQSYENWELILIDDGSTDKSLEIAKKYALKDKRIRVISDGNNRKLPYRLNQLIDESKYDFIARMDADDLMHPQRLRIQIECLINNPEIDIVSTGVISINTKNEVYGYRYFETSFLNITELQTAYPIVHATVLVRKEWYIRNRYDVKYPRSEDYELWCRASLKKDLKVAILSSLLYFYREEGNIDATKMINSYTDHYNAYLKHINQFNLTEYLKFITKCNVVKLLDNIGLLQTLAHKRNKLPIDSKVVSKYQKTLDSIIN